MFKTKPNDSFPFKVRLHAPGTGSVVCEFEGRHMDQDTLKANLDASSDDIEFCKRAICGWKRKDFDADYSDATFAQMLTHYPGMATPIAQGYLIELKGAPQIKN